MFKNELFVFSIRRLFCFPMRYHNVSHRVVREHDFIRYLLLLFSFHYTGIWFKYYDSQRALAVQRRIKTASTGLETATNVLRLTRNNDKPHVRVLIFVPNPTRRVPTNASHFCAARSDCSFKPKFTPRALADR